MAIIGTTTDYTGRTRDLFISQGINPTSSSIQPVTYTFGRVSSYIAGVQKLIQRFLISIVNAGLISKLQTQRASNIQEATYIFTSICWTVIESFRAYQRSNPGMPNDEQLATVYLVKVTTSRDTLNMTIHLITLAGDKVTFVMPIPLL